MIVVSITRCVFILALWGATSADFAPYIFPAHIAASVFGMWFMLEAAYVSATSGDAPWHLPLLPCRLNLRDMACLGCRRNL
mmetsp:Transcript_10879/g.25836  ORF Transcript_10879/g.25836 Transcript_10879/m.25836 type:complete len:81 (-) Transcript_10879:98-340(-)